MPPIGKINRKLKKTLDGKVEARVESGNIVLTGEVERWVQVITAGMLASSEPHKLGIVNDVTCTGDKAQPPRTPRFEDDKLEDQKPDVLIIGGGIIGCAVARELSRYNITVLIIEKEHDIAVQATGRSSGVVHSGIMLERGSLKSIHTKRGNQMMPEICSQLGVKYNNCGQYLLYSHFLFRFKPVLNLLKYYLQWRGFKDVEILQNEELWAKQPMLNTDFKSALYIPSAGVVDPYALTVAYAENAVQNGVVIALNTMATEMEVEDGVIKSVTTNRGKLIPRVVINAAGASCEDIATMAGEHFYSIHPVRGTSVIASRSSGTDDVNSIITAHGKQRRGKKGSSLREISVFKTNHGTLLGGPFPLETINKEDFLTDKFSIDKAITEVKNIVPDFDKNAIITGFSGVDAVSYTRDFIISSGDDVTNMIHAAGIHYPGLTAAPAIAEDIAKQVVDMFGGPGAVGEKPEFMQTRIAPYVTRDMEPAELESLIAEIPDYGVTICHCEQVSRGEIIDAINRNVRCDTVDGVKRRTRAGAGFCQGQCCSGAVLDIISREKKIHPSHIRKAGIGSEIVFGYAQDLANEQAMKAKEKEKGKPADQEKPRTKGSELSEQLRIVAEAESRKTAAKGEGGSDDTKQS